MSVRGEFRRSASDLLSFLDRHGSGEASLRELLDAARARAEDDLSGAAESVLALDEADQLDRLRDAGPSEEGAERVEHLLAIARIILGR